MISPEDQSKVNKHAFIDQSTVNVLPLTEILAYLYKKLLFISFKHNMNVLKTFGDHYLADIIALNVSNKVHRVSIILVLENFK